MHKRVIAYNTIVQFAGKIVTIILNLAIVYLLTHHFSIKDFGQYTAVFSYLLFFNVLADLGLSTILVRDINTQKNKPVFIGNIFLIRVFSLIVSLFIGVSIAQFIPQYTNAVKLGIVFGSVSTFFLLLSTLIFSIFQLKLKMVYGVLASTLGVLANLIFVIAVIHMRLSIEGAVVAVSLAYILMFVFAFYLAIHMQKISFALDLSLWKPILRQTVTVGGAIIFSTIYFKADSVILSLMRPYADVSLYGVPYKILEVLIAIPQMFMAPVFAIMSMQIAENNMEGFKNLFQKAFDMLILGSFPLIPMTIFLSSKLIPLYAGNQYIVSAGILNVLSIAVFLSFIGSSFIFVILALQKQAYLFYWNIILSFLNISLNILLIPHYTYWASAWITVLTELLVMGGSMYVVFKTLKFIPHPSLALKALLATGALIGVLMLTSPLNLFIQAILGSLGYIAVLVFLKAFLLSDVKEIISGVNPQIDQDGQELA